MKFGIIFCGECNGTLVDSGFNTPSTLKCIDCGNNLSFKVGKVNASAEFINLSECLEQAKKDAYIVG
jgi:hypothetical protein